ncbi:MAG: cation:proton antiporter [Elusimicrobiota bacterium]|jgi:NhaP-type Na+/H+ or K+/H+ antiporter|nr:cation:proton antiporter [Elusimicrobiota bacterium]
MLTSLALIFLFGMAFGQLFTKLKLPSLLGMIATGIILGPSVFNLIDVSILNVSSDIREIALVIILTRAGFALDINDLKKSGHSVIFMSFLPSIFEIGATILIAPKILGITLLDAAILGSVIAAVSPAIIVTKMIDLINAGYGKDKSIPKLIIAGASVDNVFAILMFTFFISLKKGAVFSVESFARIPASIILGSVFGILIGYLLTHLFKKIHIRDSVKVIILLSFSALIIQLESMIAPIIPFSGLVSILFVSISILRFYPVLAQRLSGKFSKVWVAAEIILFVLVGASVGNVENIVEEGMKGVLLLLAVLSVRLIGVFLSLLNTKLNIKEKIFCMGAYIPKATVQAAIGGIPLAMGLSCGHIIVNMAVLSIIVSAPLGAFAIDFLHKRCLKKSDFA